MPTFPSLARNAVANEQLNPNPNGQPVRRTIGRHVSVWVSLTSAGVQGDVGVSRAHRNPFPCEPVAWKAREPHVAVPRTNGRAGASWPRVQTERELGLLSANSGPTTDGTEVCKARESPCHPGKLRFEMPSSTHASSV